MKCRPWRWLWGLLPLALLTVAALAFSRASIERDLQDRTRFALEEAGLDWASSSFIGRDAAMTGKAYDEEDRARALEVVRNLGATRVILAVPVAPAATLRELSRYADEIVCVHRPSEFHAVGCFYDDFEPTTDAEVIGALALHHQPRRMPAPLDLRTSAAAGSRVATTL